MAHVGLVDLDGIRRVTDQPSSEAMYQRVLNAIGHDHSGSLYPEAENAVEPLLLIALDKPGWPANTALEALLDMLGSFQPLTTATEDHPVPRTGMKQRMRAAAARHLAQLAAVAAAPDEYGTSARAAQLIDVLTAQTR